MTFPTNHIKRTPLKSLHSSLNHIWLGRKCHNVSSLPAPVHGNDKNPYSAYDNGKLVDISLLTMLLKYLCKDYNREFFFEIL